MSESFSKGNLKMLHDKKSPSSIAMEAINFQRTNRLPETLKSEFEALREYTNHSKSLQRSNLTKIISEATGLNIRFKLLRDHPDGASISLPIINYNDTLLSPEFKQYAGANTETRTSELLNIKDMLVGSIDRSKATVSGIFTEYEFAISLGSNFLDKDSIYSLDEVVATVMHEMGHAYTLCEYFAQSVFTNILVDDVKRRIINADSTTKVNVIKGYVKAGIIHKDSGGLLENIKTDDEAVAVIYTDQIQNPIYLSGMSVYEYRLSEKLADQFVSRFGLASALASGLDKAYDNSFHTYYRSNLRLAFECVAQIAGVGASFFLLSLQSPLAAIVGSYAVAFYITTFIIILLLMDPSHKEYDPPRRRMLAMINDMTLALKEFDDDPEYKRSLIKQINDIEALAAKMTDNDEDALTFMISKLSISNNRKRSHSQMQALLEDLAANSLRRSTARLELAYGDK